jgi:chromosome segregation ATPase
MDIANDWLTPTHIALVIGVIGSIGVLMAVRAALQMGWERNALRRGRSALRDLPMDQAVGFSYRDWIDEHGPQLADSHFGDHLLAAAITAKSARAVTLHELHEVSARREARRIGARLSGGITALLLVCGIAGTLLAIKPLLGDFALSANSAGVMEGADNIDTATDLIKGLSTAFLPSLVALFGTLVVASARGWYAHQRGILAGELDQLDLEELFPRFPPPSLSRELDDVRKQLADLTTQMLASQRNLDGFVNRLTASAQGFHNDAPLVQKASQAFSESAKALSPRIDTLNAAIVTQLGAQSPLVQHLDALPAVAGEVSRAASQMQLSGAITSKHLQESHRLLRETIDGLSSQLEVACRSASQIIADASARALADALATSVQRVEDAAKPIAEEARSVARENQSLRDDTRKSIAALTDSVQQLLDVRAQAMGAELHRGLEAMGEQFQARLDTAQQGFTRALAGAAEDIRELSAKAEDALDKIAQPLQQIEEIRKEIAEALTNTVQAREDVAATRDAVTASIDRIGSLSERLDVASQALNEAKQGNEQTTQRLAKLVAAVDQITADAKTSGPNLDAMLESQREANARTDALANRAEEIGRDWQRWLSELAGIQRDGQLQSGDLKQLLNQGELVAEQLADAARLASEQHQRLAADLDNLTTVLDRLATKRGGGWLDRFSGRRQ